MAELQALVSVRNEAEALAVADAGVTMIDCKEPRAGALGALPPADIARIVRALRAHGFAGEISATIGDVDVAQESRQALRDVAERVARVAACGVDAVKVGVVASAAWLDALAEMPARVVPVLIADAGGLDPALVQAACERFDTLMVDTADKAAGSLLQIASPAALRRVVETAHRQRRRVGLAGALRLDDLPELRQLAPDFAGFRSAVCDGAARGGALRSTRVRVLVRALREPHAVSGHAGGRT